MASEFDYPSNTQLVGEDNKITSEWGFIFGIWHTTIMSLRQSGITADRPTKTLWIGRRYYDTTLNKPVYLRAVKPNVWRDAMGAIV